MLPNYKNEIQHTDRQHLHVKISDDIGHIYEEAGIFKTILQSWLPQQ